MSAHQLFIHLAWTTLDRKPMIDAATRSFLEEFFKKTASRQDVEIVELALLKTHVHMLIRTPSRIDLPRLVQFFKGGSSFAAVAYRRTCWACDGRPNIHRRASDRDRWKQ